MFRINVYGSRSLLDRARYLDKSLTWDQAQFKRFVSPCPPECNFQSKRKIEPDLRLTSHRRVPLISMPLCWYRVRFLLNFNVWFKRFGGKVIKILKRDNSVNILGCLSASDVYSSSTNLPRRPSWRCSYSTKWCHSKYFSWLPFCCRTANSLLTSTGSYCF